MDRRPGSFGVNTHAAFTTGQLRALLAKLVIEADPAAAATRHRQRVRGRRLVLDPQQDSTASLCLYDLPADRAVAAANRVHELAAVLKRAGDRRTMDQLRADTAVAARQQRGQWTCDMADAPTAATSARHADSITAANTGAAGT